MAGSPIDGGTDDMLLLPYKINHTAKSGHNAISAKRNPNFIKKTPK
jgi:hypothetical protein